MISSGKSNSGSFGRKLIVSISIILFVYSPSLSNAYGKDPHLDQFKSPFSLETGSYVVAGVFRYFDNAVRYSDQLYQKGHVTKYGYYPLKGYFYVYLKHFKTYDLARSSCLEFRRYGYLKEVWVMSIDSNYDIKEVFDLVGSEQTMSEEVKDNLTDVNPLSIEATTKSLTKTVESQSQTTASTMKTYHFHFGTYDVRNHSQVNAKVEIVDPEKLQHVSLLDANKVHQIQRPQTSNNTLLMLTQCFGYRKIERLVDLNDPATTGSDITIKGDTIYIDFELVRLKAGDISIMYNVYFFNNSAIIKPESRYEVNQLLTMLHENEKYQIKIHGHTNGNGYGPIIKMKDDDVNFFELSRNNREGKGSAVELSKERADTIYRYLSNKGIDKKRMKVVGWGGKKMLYKPTDPNAKLNVRVEVEILAD